MLRGIDISNWQRDMNLSVVLQNNQIDFVICKATEGLSYVDQSCDKFIQTCIQQNKLFGYYHFARNNDPKKEADYFVSKTSGYMKRGIPVLDIEEMEIKNWRIYVDEFCNRYHSMTNVWPVIYISAGHLPMVKGCYAVNNCALWVAGYPSAYKKFDQISKMHPPYALYPWNAWTMWQFTSSGRLDGYAKDVDLDFANLTADGWGKIARGDNKQESITTEPTKTAPTESDIDKALTILAQNVIAGAYGDGLDRIDNIYRAVQAKVNEILGAKND